MALPKVFELVGRRGAPGSTWNSSTRRCFTPTEAAAIEYPHISCTHPWITFSASPLERSPSEKSSHLR